MRVTAPEGSSPASALRLELQGVEGVAAAVRVLDIGGARLAEARGGKGGTLVLRNAPLVPGGALVVLRAESGATSAQRWLLRTRLEPIPESYEREPNDTAGAASQLLPSEPAGEPSGGQVAVDGATASFVGRGYLWPGDADCWRVPIDQPALLAATVEPPPSARANLRLELLGPGEQPIITIDDQGAGSGETLAPSYLPSGAAGRPGEVCLRVTARPGHDDTLAEAPYVLTASLLPDQPGAFEREPNGAAASATPLPAEGAAIRGWLAPRNDEDWYRLDPVGSEGASGQSPGPHDLEASLTVPAGMTATVRLYDAATRKPLSTGATTARAQLTGGCYLVVRGTARDAASARALHAERSPHLSDRAHRTALSRRDIGLSRGTLQRSCGFEDPLDEPQGREHGEERGAAHAHDAAIAVAARGYDEERRCAEAQHSERYTRHPESPQQEKHAQRAAGQREPYRPRRALAGEQREQRQERQHHRQLAQLDPHVEGQERPHQTLLGQPDLPQHRSKAKPMNEPKAKREEPAVARGGAEQVLHANVGDGQRDRRLDQPRAERDPAERRSDEGQ